MDSPSRLNRTRRICWVFWNLEWIELRVTRWWRARVDQLEGHFTLKLDEYWISGERVHEWGTVSIYDEYYVDAGLSFNEYTYGLSHRYERWSSSIWSRWCTIWKSERPELMNYERIYPYNLGNNNFMVTLRISIIVLHYLSQVEA